MKSLKKLSIHENTRLKIRIGDEITALTLYTAYDDVSKGSTVAIMGGHGFLEISVNQGNAAEHFDVRSGDSIRIQPNCA